MIEYRPFRNSDPPALCAIWRSMEPLRGYYQPLTPTLLESTVFAKPYFDRDGLIVATDGDQLIGFAHAGFAPNSDGSGVDTSVGTTCMLMVSDSARWDQVATQLLARSEAYLVERGARELFVGGSTTRAPFYLGLYGGAPVPGVLATDQQQLKVFLDHGYAELGRKAIMQLSLGGFRPIVDRQQMVFKRSLLVEPIAAPQVTSWWDACALGCTDRYCYRFSARTDDSTVATIVFWDMEPLASKWGVHGRGLAELLLSPSSSSEAEAVSLFVLGEALRRMAEDGATLAELHTDLTDDPLRYIAQRLGFQDVDQAVELCKVV